MERFMRKGQSLGVDMRWMRRRRKADRHTCT